MSIDADDGMGLIEKIAMEYGKSSELIKGNLRGALDVIEMTYGVAPHRQFVLEYLQNAIDSGAKRCVFKIHKNNILVSNNGSAFTVDNVKSICGIAQSSKQPTASFMGFIGIGAKSAFLLGERLEVHSGQFHFAFDSSIGKDKPWEILPQVIEKCEEQTCYIEQENYNTTFVLSRLNSGVVDNLHRVFFEPRDDYYIDARTLLFIPTDELTLEMINEPKMIMRTVSRKTLDKKEYPIDNGKTLFSETIQLEEKEGKNITERWLVLSKNIDIDVSVREDRLTKLYRRENVYQRPISIAFLLDEEGNLVNCRGVVKFGVFSFMPLKEMESGLNFLIHSDFITEPGRSTIASEAKWNLELRNKIIEFIASDVCNYLKNDDKYKSQLLILIPSQNVGGFFGELTANVKDKLRNSDIVLTYNGYKKPHDSLVLPGYVYNLLFNRIGSKSRYILYELILPTTVFKINGDYHLVEKDVAIHIERLKISRDTLRSVGIYVLPLTHIVTNAPNRKSIANLYNKIIQCLEGVNDYAELFDYLVKRELEDIRNDPKSFFGNLILLTESGDKQPLKTIFALPIELTKKSSIPPLMSRLVEKFGRNRLIDQKLLHHFRSFIKEVKNAYVERNSKIFDLTRELEGGEDSVNGFFESLKNYVSQEIEGLVNELVSAVEQGNLDNIKNTTRQLLEYFEISKESSNYFWPKQRILFKLEERTEFKPAADLFLPYGDNHNFKKIVDYIDEYIRRGCPRLHKYSDVRNILIFPDLSFYDNVEREKLQNFIKFLGGDSISTDLKRKIVEAIGLQLVAIREWRLTGREVREVDGRTHDLEVIGEPSYYIEVKSTQDTADEYEVELRVGQIEALKGEQDTRLYIITEAITNPKLIIPSNDHVINSLNIASMKIKVRELIESTTIQEKILES